MFNNSKRLWLVVLALVVLAGLLTPPAAAAERRCVFRIDEPFEVDGKLYPAGRLTLREVGDYNPAATFTEIRVDGHSLGVVIAWDRSDGTPATEDSVIFERGERGQLVLAAVAMRGEPVRRLYRLGKGDATDEWQALAQPGPKTMALARR